MYGWRLTPNEARDVTGEVMPATTAPVTTTGSAPSPTSPSTGTTGIGSTPGQYPGEGVGGTTDKGPV
jgi:hypothetical protein